MSDHEKNGENPKPPRSRTRDEGYASMSREILEEYAGLVIVVYDCEVWGKGDTSGAALQEAMARPGAPPAHEFVIAGMPPPPDPDVYFPYVPTRSRPPLA